MPKRAKPPTFRIAGRFDALALRAVTDGNAHGRTYYYNPRGELYWLSLADGTSDYWSKTARGETGAHTRPDGTLVAYTHDGAGNFKKTDYPGATPDESFAYDADDRRKTMVDASGTTTWTLDDADRITMVAQPYGATSYGYNAADQRTRLTEVGQGDLVYGYDPGGRLDYEKNRFGEQTFLGYDALGRPWTKALANGTTETYGYDGRDRKDAVTLTNAAFATLRTEGWVYDDASRITTHTVNGTATGYTYDVAGQLASESRPGYAASYTYDANGNRLTRTVNGTVENLTYDAGDKLLNVKVSGVVTRSYGYNAAGSATSVTTSAGTTTIAWDEGERAKTMNGPGFAGSYGYNGMGTRLSAVENGVVRNDLRDGTDVTADVVNDGQASYTPGLSERRGGASTFLVPGTKNIGAQTGSSGAVSATRQYDAFGNVLASTGTFRGPFGYGGVYGYREDASGLKLLGHRLYDPAAGRFLSRDPARDGRNWYAYCGNDPVNGVDPEGLQESEATKNGRAWHKFIEDYYKELHPKSFAERKLPVGRPDIIDVGRGIVVEIKPNTRRKVREAELQLIWYAEFLEYDLAIIILYPPGTKPSDFKDPKSKLIWCPGHVNSFPRTALK